MILEIEGREVEVDDSFATLSPEAQNATVEEIAASFGPQTQLGADRRMANDEQVAAQTAEGRREAYNQLPEWQKPLQALDDEARLIGNPFGVGDKLAARMNSLTGDRSYEDQLKIEKNITQAARDRAGTIPAMSSEIMGDVLTGGALAKQGVTLAGRLGTANMTGIKGVLARAGLMAPEGALYGVADAVGRDTDVATGATVGAIAGPLGSVVGDTVSKVASKVLPRANPQEIDPLAKLRDAATKAYNDADKAGVIVRPEATAKLNEKIRSELADFGYDPALQPRVKVVLDRLQTAADDNITLKGIDLVRRVADNARKSQDPSERAIGNKVIGEIDKFVERLNPQDVLTGDPKAGVTALVKARTIWSRVAKNERFHNSVETARNRASTAGSGANEENAIRQNLRRELEKGRGYTTDERAALKTIVKGTPMQNTMRWAGKMAPTGVVSSGISGSLGAMLGSIFGPAGTVVGAGALPALGYLAKRSADAGVQKGVLAVDALIRAGGSKEALERAQGTLRQLTEAQREAVARIVQTAIIQSQTRREAPAQ